MKKRDIIITILITIILIVVYGVNYVYNNIISSRAESAYLVYLKGEKIGLIKDDTELYNLINHEQDAIRQKYAVDDVYPPADFNLVKTKTYENNYMTVAEIYNKIAELDNFTIEGYIINVKVPEGAENQNFTINVLDKNIFDEAIHNFVSAFITEEEYNTYINGETEELTDVGKIIEKMYFNETITVKKGYISIKDKIYTDVNSLSQYLLFGDNAQMENYTVKVGDSIESISEDHKINSQEFIMANPKYRNANAMLEVGSNVNVTLPNPQLTFVYEVHEIVEYEEPFEKTTQKDESKGYGYSKVTQEGVNGLALNTQDYQVINGQASEEIKIGTYKVLRKKVDQITVVGKSYLPPINTGGEWGWPTARPYRITSGFAWRWGSHHDAIDISGPGEGSPIYAAKEGTVVEAQDYCGKNACSRWKEGTYLVIQHANDWYSIYAHMVKGSLKVNVGDHVTKGQVIGAMGQTGYATGYHLHFGIYKGWPYHNGGGTPYNPLRFY